MTATQLVRFTLWLTVPLNVMAAGVLAFPGSALGRLVGFPPSVPPLYAGLVGFLVLLFAGMYAWLASRPEIDRPMLALGAIGKAGVFVVALLLWLGSASSGGTVLLAAGDLGFASVWAWWLVSTRGVQATQTPRSGHD